MTPSEERQAELVADVRLLVADTDPANEVYADEQYLQFLRMEGWRTHLAAAQALETFAAHLGQVTGVMRGLLDIRVDASSSADVFLRVAANLRARKPTSPRTIMAAAGLAPGAFPPRVR